MNNAQMLVTFLVVLLLIGALPSSLSRMNRIPWSDESYITPEMDIRYYFYHSIYNGSETLFNPRQSHESSDVNLFFKEQNQGTTSNGNRILNGEPGDAVIPLLNSGPIDSAWPMHSHDVRHTGRSPYNTTIPPEGVEIWRFSCDSYVYGGPIIDPEGIIYFGCYNDNVYAMNPDGTLKWVTKLYRTIASTPAIDNNGIIYIGTIWNQNHLFALYSNNGTVKWSYYTGDDIDSSPAIGADGTIYFGDWGGWIHAVNPNGTCKWKYHTGDIITASPAIGLDGTVYCGSHDHKLYAFYPNNGTVRWTFTTGHWVRVNPCVGDDGTVYCVSLDNFLYALYPENGTMKWRVNVGAGTNPTIGSDGTIYCGYGALYAVRPNGTIKWTYVPGSGHTIRGSTPCTSAEGIIYFGTSDGGSFIAVNPNGTERWRDEYGWYESPAAIGEDGSIYVGCNIGTGTPSGCLRAFGSGEPKKINIKEPEQNHIYLFKKDMGEILSNYTIVIGSANVQLTVWSENEIDHIDFYAGYWSAEQYLLELKYSDTDPPFEWVLNEHLGNNHYPRLPFDKCRIQVIAYYKGGCTWIDEVNKFWYFHLLPF